MHSDDRRQLDWLAFQYLADEMGEGARLGFEQRLCEDQQARESVARCVELTQTLFAAEQISSLTLVDRTTRWWRRAAGAAAAIAGCMAILLAYQWVSSLPEMRTLPIAMGNGFAQTNSATSQQLAFAWLESSNELSLSHELLVAPEATAEQGSSWHADWFDDETFVIAPDWMFAAIWGLADKVNDRSNSDVEMAGQAVEN